MSNPPSPLRPAPLSFNSGRASPFRRPESPLGRSPSTIRAATPQGSPLKQSTPNFTSSTSSRPFSPQPAAAGAEDRSWITTRGTTAPSLSQSSPTKSPLPSRLDISNSFLSGPSPFDSPISTPTTARPSFGRPLPAPSASSSDPNPFSTAHSTMTSMRGNDALSSIPPQHLHTMRESFAVLDRSNSGIITPADLSTHLSDLGLDTSSAALSSYFPPGQPPLNLSTYLNLLSSDLSRLSRQEELLAAFSAFDDDDSGQIDIGELRDALVSTMPEAGDGRRLSEDEVEAVMQGYCGRRMFKRGAVGNSAGLGGAKKNGEVFRYGDFVSGIWGAGGTEAGQQVAQ